MKAEFRKNRHPIKLINVTQKILEGKLFNFKIIITMESLFIYKGFSLIGIIWEPLDLGKKIFSNTKHVKKEQTNLTHPCCGLLL